MIERVFKFGLFSQNFVNHFWTIVPLLRFYRNIHRLERL